MSRYCALFGLSTVEEFAAGDATDDFLGERFMCPSVNFRDGFCPFILLFFGDFIVLVANREICDHNHYSKHHTLGKDIVALFKASVFSKQRHMIVAQFVVSPADHSMSAVCKQATDTNLGSHEFPCSTISKTFKMIRSHEIFHIPSPTYVATTFSSRKIFQRLVYQILRI